MVPPVPLIVRSPRAKNRCCALDSGIAWAAQGRPSASGRRCRDYREGLHNCRTKTVPGVQASKKNTGEHRGALLSRARQQSSYWGTRFWGIRICRRRWATRMCSLEGNGMPRKGWKMRFCSQMFPSRRKNLKSGVRDLLVHQEVKWYAQGDDFRTFLRDSLELRTAENSL
jgi:hypothetical protein